MNLLKINIFLIFSLISVFHMIECAPRIFDILENIQEEDDVQKNENSESKRFIVPWLQKDDDTELTLQNRGQNDEPEFKEDVNSTFDFDLNAGFGEGTLNDLETKEREFEKRASSSLVHEWTVYRKNKKPFTSNIQKLCTYAHNFFRSKHMNTPLLKYVKNIERSAEKYATYLASTGKFEHDDSLRGYGENLYRLDNTYNLVATPIHAIMAWYEESWIPLTGRKENYNYNWNPESAKEFFDSGVGHFTQFIWDTTTLFGCGAATTTYNKDGRKWTRTVIVTRYEKPGNILGQFPKHLHPLKKGGTMEGVKRGKLYPVKGKCVNTVHPKECNKWKQYNWCDRTWAKRDCYCTCGFI